MPEFAKGSSQIGCESIRMRVQIVEYGLGIKFAQTAGRVLRSPAPIRADMSTAEAAQVAAARF